MYNLFCFYIHTVLLIICFYFIVIPHGIAVSTKNWFRLDQGPRSHWVNPTLCVYSSTDCTVKGVWTRGTQPDFQHANKAIVCFKIVSCIYVVSIKSKPSAILLLNHLHKVSVPSPSVQYKSWLKSVGVQPWPSLLNILLACSKIVPNVWLH